MRHLESLNISLIYNPRDCSKSCLARQSTVVRRSAMQPKGSLVCSGISSTSWVVVSNLSMILTQLVRHREAELIKMRNRYDTKVAIPQDRDRRHQAPQSAPQAQYVHDLLLHRSWLISVQAVRIHDSCSVASAEFATWIISSVAQLPMATSPPTRPTSTKTAPAGNRRKVPSCS